MIAGRVSRIWKARVEFCERHLPSFEVLDAGNDNHGEFRYQMFTVLTQHVYADSITQLIDLGLKIEKERVASSEIRYKLQKLIHG